MKNYYDILGITPDADQAVIKAVYRALCQKYHPDRFKGDGEYATEKMHVINAAYEILSDPIKRKAYDMEWGHSGDYQSSQNENTEYANYDSLEKEWEYAISYIPELSKSFD